MDASRNSTCRAVIGLVAALGGSWAQAADPRPVAGDTPAFRAPAEPPADTAVEAAPASEPVAPLELQDALALALMRSPQLAAFSWESRASEARALQAGKPPNPELDVRLYRLGIPRQDTRPDEARWRVVFSQVFELGDKARRRFELARTEIDLAEWDYEAKRIEVATDVVRHFVAVLGAQRRVDSWKRTLEFFEQMRDRVQVLAESGTLRSLATHRVRRQVGLVRIELQRVESELFAARFRLSAMWGGDAPRFTEAVGELEPVRTVPDIETVMRLARISPAVARWDAELERGKAALALAKAGRAPDLTAGAGIRWEEHSNDRDYLVDVELSLPLLDRKQGDIREARFDMARARAARKAAEAASHEQIAALYYRLEQSVANRSTLADEILPAVRATFEAHRLGLDRQVDYLWDLLDARRDLARAEVQMTDALVDFHEALAELEGVVGQSLTPAE